MHFSKFLLGVAVSTAVLSSTFLTASAQEQPGRPPEGGRGRPGGEGGPPSGSRIGGGFRGGIGGGIGGGGGMGGIPSLIRITEIQEALKLDESQKKEVTEKTEAAFKAMREQFSTGRGPGGGRPEGGRPEGGRPEGGRPEGGRPEGGRPEGGRPSFGGGQNSEEMAKMIQRAQEAREKLESELMSILDPDQSELILGILIKSEDGRSLTSPSLRENLSVNPEQYTKIKAVTTNSMKEMQEFFSPRSGENGRPGEGVGGDAMREKIESFGKKVNGEMLAVLTPEQKAAYDKLLALAANVTLPERSRGGPGGGPGGPGGGPGGPGGGPGGNREGGRPSRPESSTRPPTT